MEAFDMTMPAVSTASTTFSAVDLVTRTIRRCGAEAVIRGIP
jgi:hypothetical protein